MTLRKNIWGKACALGVAITLAAGAYLFPSAATDQVTPASVSAQSISQLVAATSPTEVNPFLVGAGVSDITGEVAEVGFMGYGSAIPEGERPAHPPVRQGFRGD